MGHHARSPMHIAYHSPGWPLEKFHNGIVTYVHWMKHELESMGHRVSVFATDAGGFAEASGIYQIPAPTRMSRALSKMRRFLRRGHGSAHQVFDYSSAISESVLRIH